MGNLEHNLTEGSVIKNLILFSLPFVGSFVLQSLYSTVDLFIVVIMQEHIVFQVLILWHRLQTWFLELQ